MNKDLVIAERELLFIKPDGEEILSSIQLGKPYVSEKYGTLCDFEIPKIHKKQFGAGADGIQAIILTMSMVETVLSLKIKKGLKIFLPDSKEEIELHEIFDITSLMRNRNEN